MVSLECFCFYPFPYQSQNSLPYHTLLRSIIIIEIHCKLAIINLLLLGNSLLIISYYHYQFIISIIKLFLIKLHIKYHRYQSWLDNLSQLVIQNSFISIHLICTFYFIHFKIHLIQLIHTVHYTFKFSA